MASLIASLCRSFVPYLGSGCFNKLEVDRISLPEILNAQKNLYQKNFLAYGDSPKGTFQNDYVTMHLRYQRLLAQFDFSGRPSLLDVGCGVGDLYGYLKERDIPHTYCGSEIVPEMVQMCTKKYPGICVNTSTVFDMAPRSYDYIVLSGCLNIAGDVMPQDWAPYAQALIARMFQTCRLGVAFNFLTTKNDFQDENLYYFDPSVLVTQALALSRFVNVDHAYPLFECTITISTGDCLRAQYRDAALQRYLKSH